MATVKMREAQNRLAMLWFGSCLVLALLLFLQTIVFEHFGDKYAEPWEWFLPNVLPTLSLVVAVITAERMGKRVRIVRIDGFLFKLTFVLSSFYLLVIALILVLGQVSVATPLEMMQRSSLLLGPFQGLVSATLGTFFVREATPPPSG